MKFYVLKKKNEDKYYTPEITFNNICAWVDLQMAQVTPEYMITKNPSGGIWVEVIRENNIIKLVNNEH